MEIHHHHTDRKMIPEIKIQVTNQNDTNNTDHSKMDHNSMKHEANPSMGMEGHDHHLMTINDFKKRFVQLWNIIKPCSRCGTDEY